MKEIDFSQMENMASMFGISPEIMRQMTDGINEKIQSGEIDEKTAAKMQKDCAKSAKVMNKLTEKIKKKGIQIPDMSNLDLSNINGMDMSFMNNMDIGNLSEDDISRLKDVAKDIMPDGMPDIDDIMNDDALSDD